MSDNKPEDAEPPLDDYGIDHDRILEICEKMIERLHQKYVIEESSPKNAAEINEVTASLQNIWNLTQSILELDDVIRTALEALIQSQQGNPDVTGEEDQDEMDDEDLEDDI